VLQGPAQDAVTNAQGQFMARGVSPGEQTVCLHAAGATGGSSSTGYLNTCVGGGNSRTATPVHVDADRSTSVHVSLVAGAAISGQVTPGSGHLRFVEVLALGRRSSGAVGRRGSGMYRMTRLPAGTYVVCFLADRFKSQCFDNVRWDEGQALPRSARRLVLRPGEQRNHVDAVLHR
jgi:hypothetical protein